MNNESNLKINVGKSGWQLSFEHENEGIWVKILDLIKDEGLDPEAINFCLARPDGKYFHLTMVEARVSGKNGDPITFLQPMLFEHDNGSKVGDVSIIFRKNPSGRWMIQTDQEDVYEDETTIKKLWRTVRSSLDNIIQSVKKTVVHSGWIYSNARRIGGKAIQTHYVIAGWSPQLAEKMMDVFDYIQTLDSMGLACFVKALQHMPSEPAREIFEQMRIPFDNGDSE